MRRRAIMVDVDGVVIAHPDPGGWSVHLERDLGIAAPDLQRVFFKPHWLDVVHGRAALRERLAPALAEIAPTVSCDRLIDYWFSNDAHLNQRLIEEVEAFRSAGIEVHLATVQEHERASFIWERLDLKSSFDGIHYAAALAAAKPAAAFYRSIERAVGLNPTDIFFVDDTPANVDGARACGWTAALWTRECTLRSLMAGQGWDAD